MNRRHFLKYTIPSATLPFFLNGIAVKAIAGSPFVNATAATSTDRILIIVQLFGGNDGLNTVLPVDQYQYLSMSNSNGGRSNILIQESKGVPFVLNNVNQYPGTRMNAGMQAFGDMYGDQHLCVVQNVSYANPDFSHFRATDIWLSGSDSSVYDKTGWGGRYVDVRIPDYVQHPTPSPVAITIGAASSNAFINGTGTNLSIAMQNPDNNQSFIGNVDTAPNSLYGYELDFIRGAIEQSNQFGVQIKQAYDYGTNAVTYPANNSLADQLKTVCRLISGGLQTKIYHVSAGGFDTHANQVDSSDTSKGYHADLWKSITEAIAAFQRDLASQSDATGPLDDRVMGLTFSEFGRTIKSNTTTGTDHGTAGPMFLFGKHVNPIVLGQNAQVWDTANNKMKSDIDMNFDYRSVYASILHQWFKVSTVNINKILGKVFLDETALSQDIYDGGFHCNLPIFKGTFVPRKAVAGTTDQEIRVKPSYPNPFVSTTEIPYNSEGGLVQIAVYDQEGKQIKVLLNEEKPKGEYQVSFDGSNLVPGLYYYRIKTASTDGVGKMIKQ